MKTSMQPTCPLPNEAIVNAAMKALGDADLHAKTIKSIAQAVLGLVHSPRLSITSIGTSWARVTGHKAKHGVKQVDHLVGSDTFDVRACLRSYVPVVIGARKLIVVALDWTEFEPDGHSTLKLSLITRHGRATPLAWMTVDSSTLKDRRNAYEDDLLHFFKKCLPERSPRVIVLADRGFGDVALYAELEEELGFEFVIRFRGNVYVEHQGTQLTADQWLRRSGSALILRDVTMTHKARPVRTFVAVHDSGMKDAWFLASSLRASLRALVKFYSRRFTIEETFRDQKDMRFGWALHSVLVTQVPRRDRLLMLAAIAQLVLTLLGAAGEQMGLDRDLRVNTVKRRTHSLFRQGREYIKGLATHVARELRHRFTRLLNGLSTNHMQFGEI